MEIEINQKVEVLLAEIESERRKRRALLYAMGGCLAGGIALVVLLKFLKWWETGAFHFDDLTGLLSMTSLITLFAVTSRHKQASAELARLDDIRGVGALVEAMTFDDKSLKQISSEALTRLLPRMRSSDSHLLNKKHHEILNRVLRNPRPPQSSLAIAILKAYQQVGDETDLEAVVRLSEKRAVFGHDNRIVEGATECLPFLKQRIEHLETQRTLLRAAAAPSLSEQQETLLRPVQSNSIALSPQEMLRASQNPVVTEHTRAESANTYLADAQIHGIMNQSITDR